mmetsp:Transcript_7350/g.17433  ORF Transcript_7350/g.17433 Transcript_7350/m.17433 type:complete len:82 (-) Transcript_7350:466-711(-)
MSLGPRWSTADPLLPRGFKAVGGALLCVSRCEGKGPPQPVACSKLRGQDFMQRNAFRLSLGEGRFGIAYGHARLLLPTVWC